MGKKVSIIAFIFVLISNTIFTSIGLPVQVQAISNPEKDVFANISLIDEAGEVINAEKQISPESAVRIQLDWKLTDANVRAGDVHSIKLPPALKIIKQESGKLIAKDGLEVASYEVATGGMVSVTVNDEIEIPVNETGTITIPVIFDKEVIKDSETTALTFINNGKAQVIDVAFEIKAKDETTEEATGESKETEEETIAEDTEVVDQEGGEIEDEKTEAPEETIVEDTGEKEEQAADIKEDLSALKSKKELKSTEIKGNILTSTKLIIQDEKGNVIESAGPDSIISVYYDWALENGHGYAAGSTFTFQLPAELEVYEFVIASPMKAPNGDIFGHFSVAKDGTATVEFTEYIEHHSNIKGTLEVLTELSKDIIITEDKEIIVTPIEGGDSIKVPITYNPGGPAIEKKGVPNKGYNAETIEWTVDFNKTLEKIENAVLNDPIQAGQKLQKDSLKLYHLITKMDGTVTLGELVDQSKYIVGNTTDGKDFSLDFRGDINTAYRVVYTTDITDGDQKDFKNTAELLSNGTKVADASASVGVQRGHPIAKKAAHYDSKNQTITWQIRYNYDEKNIAQVDAYLRDAFLKNDSQELMRESIVVKDVTIDSNGKEMIGEVVEKGDYTVTYNVDGTVEEAGNPINRKFNFNLQFNKDIDSAYIIEYKTKATDRVFDGIDIENRIYLADDRYSTGKQHVGQQILFKNHGTPNYKDKIIEWTISFNHDHQEMKNVLLTDVFTNGGLTLDPESIVITNNDGKLASPGDYEIVKDEQNEFVIQFNKTINSAHTIKYKTDFDYEQRKDKSLNYLQNKATLAWTDKDGAEKTKEAQSNFTPNDYTQFNGFKNSSYNAITQEITWSIVFNYNLQKLTSASIEDFITQSENLKVDLTSIEVHKVIPKQGENAVEVGELVSPDLYTKTEIEKDGKKGFKVEFRDEINEAYQITYKTSLKNLSFVEKIYDNKVTVFDGTKKQADLTASVSIPHGGAYTTKSAEQNGKIIDWKVNINFAQAKVNNATVIDTPSDNQSVLEQSFHLYATKVAENGTVTKGDELKLGEDYTLKFTEDPYSFELKFNNEISKPYTLEYQSLILAKTGDKINNDISFKGDKTTEGPVSESKSEIVVKHTTGMGTGSGEVGSLTLTKTDANDGKLLPDATFTLKDADSGVVIKTATTNSNGEIVFDKLLFGDYLLIEDKAPEGYLENSEAITITIGGDNGSASNSKTIKNMKIIRAVELEKLDSENPNKKLGDAEFELQQKDEDKWVTLATLTTNDQGIIYKDELKPGEYQFVETKPRLGYELDKTPIPFTIKEKQTEKIKVTKKNTKTKREIEGTKDWKDGDSKERPQSIVVELLRNDEIIKEVEVTAARNWTFSFVGLDEYNDESKKYTYTVREKEVEGYKSSVDGFNITNVRAGITSVEGMKIWKDDNAADRPEVIKVNLLQNDIVVETKEVTKESNWSYSFKDLAKYDENGVVYKYTVKEQGVPGYKSEVDGFNITNIKSEQISVPVTKGWKDDNATDRPDSIQVNLLRDGEPFKEAMVTAENEWKHEFTELEAYDDEGVAYEYTIEEVEVAGYETKIAGFDITNLRVGKTSVEGTKTWKDDNSADRPEKIKVDLLQNSRVIDTQEVTAETDWKFLFLDLQKYDDEGVVFKYAVKEHEVDGYNSTVDNYDITNVRTGTTSVEGKKIWKDDNATDRPEKIKVDLLQNGKVVDAQEVTSDANWKYLFPELQKYDDEGVAYQYTVKEHAVDGYDSTVDDFNITNVRVGKTSVEGTKTWKDDNATDRPEKIKVDLLRNGKVVDTREITAEADWKYYFTDLQKYDDEGVAYNYAVKEQMVDGYDSTVNGFNITNVRVGVTSVEGTKTWKDDNAVDRPEVIKVNLLKNGAVEATQEVTKESNWSYSFKDLAKYDENGVLYKYTVKEQGVPGYKSEVDVFNITNIKSEKTSVTVTKGWKDDNAADRPDSIQVNLLRNGEPFKEAIVTAKNEWNHEFTELEAYDDEGKAYEYTIEEVEVAGYETKIAGFDITNLRVGKTSVEGTKTWKDNNSADRPEKIKVDLLRNGDVVDTKEVTNETNWDYLFTDLQKYDDEGVVYNYAVKEHAVNGYNSTVDGFNITNVRVGTTSVEGTKTWKDANATDRPEKIKVDLLQNGEVIDTKEVTVETNWKYLFTDLQKYDDEGIAYKYEVKERAVDGYASAVEGFDITNVRVGTSLIEGTKTWKDDNAADRPEKIKVNLLQNGKVVYTKEVAAETDWKYLFADLQKYDEEGVAYHYEVQEHAFDGYDSIVEGFDITNVRVGITSVEGTKTWKDDNSADRPEMIKVNLLKNGVVEATQEVTKTSNWSYSFKDLAKYDENGAEYEYAVKEQGVPGYKSEVNGFNITNIKSEQTSVNVTKGWKDDNAKDRPDSIKVNLLRNGEPIKEAIVTAKNEWTHDFTDLEAYDDEGIAYEYTIEEAEVAGYKTKMDGYDITNIRVGITSVEGTKTWKGDHATNRPDSIQVDLLQNGKVINTVEVTDKAGWMYSFKDLAEFDENGVAYMYTVKEQRVDGYTSIIDGYDITNILDPEPVKPTEPTEPGEQVNKPGGEVKPVSGNKPGNYGGKLPQTGEEQFMYMMIAGFLLLAMGGVLIFRRKKKA